MLVTLEMAQCGWGAKKMQMEVELFHSGGCGAGKANAGGSGIGHSQSPARLGWRFSREQGPGADTCFLMFLKYSLKGSCCLSAAKLGAFYFPVQGFSSIPSNKILFRGKS